MDSNSLTPLDRFYLHLDCCGQCRDHAFNLCLAGTSLIEQIGHEVRAANNYPRGHQRSPSPATQTRKGKHRYEHQD